MEVFHKDLAYQIMGACFEVHNSMGAGFLESVYQECLEIELEKRDILYAAQETLAIAYKGQQLSQKYIPHFIIDQKVILEIKALSNLTPDHRGQTLNLSLIHI